MSNELILELEEEQPLVVELAEEQTLETSVAEQIVIGSANLQSKSVSYTPTESAQSQTVSPDAVYDGLSSVGVSVGAIDSNYVGSGVTRGSSSTVLVEPSDNSIAVGAGYYENIVNTSMPLASVTGADATINSSTGAIGVSVTVGTAGYIAANTYNATAASSVDIRTSADLQEIGATVGVPAGYYPNSVSKTLPTASLSATAAKGAVSNHSVSVTPTASVTSAGYKPVGSKTGTAVTVSASELVSGTKSITANGTGIDVTEYAAVDVAVPSGSPTLQNKTIHPSASDQSITADTGYDGLGTVTAKAVTLTNLTAANIVSGVTVKVGDVDDDDRVASVTGTASGGSGATTVASGTFAGNSTNGRMTINVGSKMPKTDFYIQIKAKNGEDFARNSDYTYVLITSFTTSDLGYFDLSEDGNSRPYVPSFSVDDDNSGTITSKTVGQVKIGALIRNGGTSAVVPSRVNIHRNSGGYFQLYFGHDNVAYKWPSTVTYEYKIVYFGSNAATDIIDLS